MFLKNLVKKIPDIFWLKVSLHEGKDFCILLYIIISTIWTSCSSDEFVYSQKIKITEYIIFIFRHYTAETQVTHRYFFNFEQVYLENG